MAGWLLCSQKPATFLQQGVASRAPDFQSCDALFVDGLLLFVHGICRHLSYFESVPCIDYFYYIHFKFLDVNIPYFNPLAYQFFGELGGTNRFIT
jgi:hypothetical protein